MTIENSLRLFFKGVKIDDRTEKYIRRKLVAIEKTLKNVTRVEVEIDIDKKKNKFRVEVMIKTPRKLYRAEESTVSIEGSIDAVEDELKNQISSEKGKKKTLLKRGARSIKKKMVVADSARL